MNSGPVNVPPRSWCRVCEDLKHYLGMRLKAETLRRWGLRVQVNGQWRRWLVVIEGGKGQERGNRRLSLKTKTPKVPSFPQEVLPPSWVLWF